jgi:hypothetical protein
LDGTTIADSPQPPCRERGQKHESVVTDNRTDPHTSRAVLLRSMVSGRDVSSSTARYPAPACRTFQQRLPVSCRWILWYSGT